MLILRDDQKAALEAAALTRFARRLLLEVKAAWPSKCEGRSGKRMLAEIEAVLKQARAFSIVGESSMRAYVDIAMLLGHDFVEQPAYAWTKVILEDPERPQADKIYQLQRRILNELSDAD